MRDSYSVIIYSYQMFGLALAQSFENVLGKEVCTSATKEAWYLLVQSLAEIMTKEYSTIKSGFITPIYHRDNRGKWRLLHAFMNHDKLVLYTDATRKKIKNEWILSHIDALEVVDDATTRLEAPNPWCFSISLESTVNFYFCAPSEEELDEWTKDLTERISAYQRAGRYANDSSSGDEDSSEGPVDVKTKAKKRAMKLQKAMKLKAAK